MNLEWSAVTMASHIGLVIAVVFAFLNAVAALRNWDSRHAHDLLVRIELPILSFLASLIAERSYYICARFLSSSGVDLWEAHPAPEVLSALMAITMFWLAATLRRHGTGVSLAAYDRLTLIQAGAISGVFLVVSWGFW